MIFKFMYIWMFLYFQVIEKCAVLKNVLVSLGYVCVCVRVCVCVCARACVCVRKC